MCEGQTLDPEGGYLDKGSQDKDAGICLLIPEVTCVFSHVHTEVMLPLGNIATFGAHVILGVGVGQHVLGQVAHVSAGKVTQLTLVRFLTLCGGGSRGERAQSDTNPASGQSSVSSKAVLM